MSDPITLPAPPELPYTVEDLPMGPFLRPTRKYPNGKYGEILSEDEIKVWKVVQALREMVTALVADRAELVNTAMTIIAPNFEAMAENQAVVDGREPEGTDEPPGDEKPKRGRKVKATS